MNFNDLVRLCESDENKVTKHVTYFEEWSDSGRKITDKIYEIYYTDKNGHDHRLDGPAVIRFYENGNKRWQIWFRHGKKHRLDGPAYEEWDEHKNKIQHIYFINDKEYTKKEFDEYTKGLQSKEDKELLGDLGQTFD